MMFVCYALVFAILGSAYHSPEFFLLAVMLIYAPRAFR